MDRDITLDDLWAEVADEPGYAESRRDAADRLAMVAALTDLRKSCHMTQRDVAAAMGTGQSAISELECGGTDPRVSTVQRYARAVGKRLTWCLDDPEDKGVRGFTLAAPLMSSSNVAVRWDGELLIGDHDAIEPLRAWAYIAPGVHGLIELGSREG